MLDLRTYQEWLSWKKTKPSITHSMMYITARSQKTPAYRDMFRKLQEIAGFGQQGVGSNKWGSWREHTGEGRS